MMVIRLTDIFTNSVSLSNFFAPIQSANAEFDFMKIVNKKTLFMQVNQEIFPRMLNIIFD